MKKLFSYCLLLCACRLFGQQTIIDDSVVLKRGIYQTFEEFKFNKPSIICDFKVDSFPVSYGMYSGKKLISYKLVLDKQVAKTIRNDYGFCDGKNVYIKKTDENGEGKYNIYNKIIEFGIYSCFHEINLQMIYSPWGFGGIPVSDGFYTQMIDMNTGELLSLLKENISIVFKNDSIIYNAIKENPKTPLIDFLKMYNNKHKSDGFFANEQKMTTDDANTYIKKLPADSNLQIYFNRLYLGLRRNSAFRHVIIDRKNYSNGKLKSLGISLQHNFNGIEEYRYKVGTWYYCYEDGSLKEEIEFDINEKKLSTTKYDKEGNLIK